MAVDAEHPGNVGRDFGRELVHRGGELGELLGALGIDRRLAGIEQHFGLEHEAVADDADVGAAFEDFAQAAEEVGAVAREVGDALGEGDVEPAAEVGDRGAALAVADFRCLERLLERRDLGAERGELLVEQRDLGLRFARQVLRRAELAR